MSFSASPFRRAHVVTLQSKVQHAARLLGIHVERHPPRSGLFGHVLHVLRRYDIDHVIDIGANVGQFGSSLRAVGYKGSIYSFEPVPEACAELEKRASRDARWHTERL